MAVYQISRIQIRRGQAQTGTGIPQLASGEMAWAIDTQELYIGNGAVSEGAPAVGNTKILTENSPILELAELYQYKANDSTIQTGVDVNYPVKRTLQERLDDNLNAASFGVVADGVTDQTANIQHAIDQLWLNLSNAGVVSSRVSLEFSPGTYVINNTIYLPSYVTLVGAGENKTVFNFTGTGVAFEFVNDTSTPETRSLIESTTYNNQPKFCRLEGFTVKGTAATTEFFKLNAVRDSIFRDIRITFDADPLTTDAFTPYPNTTGIGLYALSSVVTSQRNTFSNIFINECYYSIYSMQDILNNMFERFTITDTHYAFAFGVGADQFSVGEQYGPRKNVIKHCYFENVVANGVLIEAGSGNRLTGNTFKNILGEKIVFLTNGNTSVQDDFDDNPDVRGKINFQKLGTNQVTVTNRNFAYEAFRIPINSSTGFVVNYICKSNVYEHMRRGQLTIAVDLENSNVQLVDEYDYTGTFGEETNLQFSASISGTDIVVTYTNISNGDSAILTYTYSALS